MLQITNHEMTSERDSHPLKMAARNRKSYEVLQKEIENGKYLVENAKSGDIKAIKELLNKGTQVNSDEYNRSLFYASKNYVTPLQCAAASGHTDCVKLLLNYEGNSYIRKESIVKSTLLIESFMPSCFNIYTYYHND